MVEKDVEEHQGRVSEKTESHADVCQVSGGSMHGENAEVEQQEGRAEREHGRRVDDADVFAQL